MTEDLDQQQQQHGDLGAILQVLLRIESTLNNQEERFQRLEHVAQGGHPRTDTGILSINSSTILGSSKEQELLEQVDEHEGDIDHKKNDTAEPLPRISYTDWSVDHLLRSIPSEAFDDLASSPHAEHDVPSNISAFFNLKLSDGIERRLGDCWRMPDDNRLSLMFFKANVLKSFDPWVAPFMYVARAKQRFERDLDYLCHFDDDVRSQQGNDFVVIDFDGANNSRIFRLGKPAIGPDLMVDPESWIESPWSRIILYQGATTGDSVDPGRKRVEQPIPYFSRTRNVTGVWDHISYHLQLKRRNTTINPYAQSPAIGFHTTFYEIVEDEVLLQKEVWKHGPLYEHPLGWSFRKCAFTIYSSNTQSDNERYGRTRRRDEIRYWTILVLAPNRFFKDSNPSFPLQDLDPGVSQTLGHAMGRMSRLGAELNLIGYGMEQISRRWTDFQTYFDYILDSGDSLMKPGEHDDLLFDDAAFSRSRKYFWAIDCLSEFNISISDNLAQFDCYRDATLTDLIRAAFNEAEARQLIYAETQYRALQAQRDWFRQKLAATRALRDALFNASAVIESRASTRLGENVKLLTFVSIFFLPLAFTTSLWSINTTFSGTSLIYTIILVALTTYIVMFNINSLAEGLNTVYAHRKRGIINAMKSDNSTAWNTRAQRFELFRPKYENVRPSEWLIPLYAITHLIDWTRRSRSSATDTAMRARATGEEDVKKRKLLNLARLIGRRDQKQKGSRDKTHGNANADDRDNEEGWVL